jgi:hypothetical protein
MNVICGFTELLLQQNELAVDHREYLQYINTSASMMLSLLGMHLYLAESIPFLLLLDTHNTIKYHTLSLTFVDQIIQRKIRPFKVPLSN